MNLKLQTRAVVGFAAAYLLFAAVAVVANLLLMQAYFNEGDAPAGDLQDALVEVAEERGIPQDRVGALADWLLFDGPSEEDVLPDSVSLEEAESVVVEVLERYDQLRQSESLTALLRISVVIALATAGLAAALSWVLSRRLLRPVRQLTHAASEATSSHLGERINYDGPNDELKEMAEAFDLMLERLQRSIEVQRQFAANAAHELRGPLALMRAELDVARTNPDASPDQHDLIDAIEAASRRSERIVTALLELHHADGGIQYAQDVDLSIIVGDLVAESVTAFTSRHIRVDLDIDDGGDPHALIVEGDKALLSVLCHNIISNAAQHALSGSTASIHLGLVEGGKAVQLVVENSTEPLDVGDLTSLLEPLQRGHGRVGDGGHGLGLAIARSAAEAHGAEITIRQPDPTHFEVRLHLPRKM